MTFNFSSSSFTSINDRETHYVFYIINDIMFRAVFHDLQIIAITNRELVRVMVLMSLRELILGINGLFSNANEATAYQEPANSKR